MLASLSVSSPRAFIPFATLWHKTEPFKSKSLGCNSQLLLLPQREKVVINTCLKDIHFSLSCKLLFSKCKNEEYTRHLLWAGWLEGGKWWILWWLLKLWTLWWLAEVWWWSTEVFQSCLYSSHKSYPLTVGKQQKQGREN